MGSVVVLASGSGTNFQAICERLAGSPHTVSGLICDRPGARVLERARASGVPSVVVPYARPPGGTRRLSEERMAAAIREWSPDLIVLAGFMRVLSPEFVDEFAGRIINIHPSLLPLYPGLDAIRRSYEAGDQVVGITVHFVDHGVDSGTVIRQERITRERGETLDTVESRIHALEHETYPAVVLSLLARSDRTGGLERPA